MRSRRLRKKHFVYTEMLLGESRDLTNDTTLKNRSSFKAKSPIITIKIKDKLSDIFTVKTLKKRLPCLCWFPNYNSTSLIGDCIAGLTVSLLIIPQALAYGLVAGLPPNYGLYSAFVGGIVYFFLGSTKELSIGPTAIMSLLTYQYSRQGGPDYAVLLCFLAGIIEIVAGFVNLGFFINFISQPVISGFLSAAALTIATSQVKGLFGLKLTTNGVVDTWYKIFLHISETRWQDLVLGISCIIVLLLIKHLHTWNTEKQKKYEEKPKPYLQKIIFYFSVGRNALIVLIASLIAFFLDDQQPFTLTGEVTPGIPAPQLPPFSTTINNETISFEETIDDIGLGIIMIPFIAILDDIAVVSSLNKGGNFDVSQEIIALGVINLIGSFFRSIPTTASLSRTSVNLTSGVHTPAAGLLTGIIVLLALAVFTPHFRYIPKATLSAVIMCAVMHMLDYEIIKPLWRTKKLELIHLSVTFLACLFIGLEWGILLGIAVNLLLMLCTVATPTVCVTRASFPITKYPYVLVTPASGMLYPSTMHIRTIILKAGLKEGKETLPVLVNCTHIASMDYTSCKGMAGIIDVFAKREQSLVFLHMKTQVRKTLKTLKAVSSYESIDEVEKALYLKKSTEPEHDSNSDPGSDLEVQVKLRGVREV